MKKFFGCTSTLRVFLVTLALAVSSSLNMAAPLPPGGFLNPPLDEGKPVGAIPIDQLVEPYVGADIQGTLISTVWASDVSNPFGGLTFTYEILTDFASTAPVENFTVGNYGGFSADASYSLFGGGGGSVSVLPVAPVYVGRSFNGNIISYDFSLFGNPGIMPGDNSAVLVVQTDVPFYSPTVASVINAGSAEVLSFAPEPVPEPTTFALLGLGSLALVMVRRRK